MQKSIFTIAQERNISHFLFSEPPVQGNSSQRRMESEKFREYIMGLHARPNSLLPTLS